MIFHVTHNSITKDGETAEEREAHLAKNADHQRRRDEEAAQGANEDGRGPPHQERNLKEAFDMVDDQPVYQTPSANLAITFNELDKLPHTLEVEKVRAHIIAVQVQVIDTAPVVTEETSIMAPRALDLRLELPTYIEDPEATMKLIHAMMAAHRAPGRSGW